VYKKYRINLETVKKVKEKFTLEQEVMAQWGNIGATVLCLYPLF
jgi:hypothetical protein